MKQLVFATLLVAIVVHTIFAIDLPPSPPILRGKKFLS